MFTLAYILQRLGAQKRVQLLLELVKRILFLRRRHDAKRVANLGAIVDVAHARGNGGQPAAQCLDRMPGVCASITNEQCVLRDHVSTSTVCTVECARTSSTSGG